MKYYAMVLACFILFCTGNAAAGLGIAGRISTQGYGLEVTQSMIPTVNVRGGAYFLNFDPDGILNFLKDRLFQYDVEYDYDVKLRSISLLLDVHPFPSSGFRLTGGVMFNGNKVDMVGEPQGTYEIGNQTYTGAQIGSLIGKMTFRSAAPYAGIGWGNATKSRFGFALDLGVAFQGAPDVNLSATGPVAADPTFQAELQKEEQEIKDDTDAFKFYPVVSLGLSFKLGLF